MLLGLQDFSEDLLGGFVSLQSLPAGLQRRFVSLHSGYVSLLGGLVSLQNDGAGLQSRFVSLPGRFVNLHRP